MNSSYGRYYTFIRPVARNKYIRTYSSLAFSLVAVMIFAIFAIKPTVTTILVLEQRINEQRQIADGLKKKSQNLTLGKQNLEKIDSQTLDKLNALLPSKTDITTIGESVSSIARQNGASVSAIQFQPTDLKGQPSKLNPNPSQNEVSFVLNLTGSYDQLLVALTNLLNSPRLVQIDSVTLSQLSANVLTMSVSLRSFYLQN